MTPDLGKVSTSGLPAAKSGLTGMALPVRPAAVLHRLHESWLAVPVEVPIGPALGPGDGAELVEVSGRWVEGLRASGRRREGCVSVQQAVLLRVATSSG